MMRYKIIMNSVEGYYTGKRGKKKWSNNIADAKKYFSNHSAGCVLSRLRNCTTLTLLMLSDEEEDDDEKIHAKRV